jgi:hypothetical protein
MQDTYRYQADAKISQPKSSQNFELLSVGFPVPMVVHCRIDGVEMSLSGAFDHVRQQIYVDCPEGVDKSYIEKFVFQHLLQPAGNYEAPQAVYDQANQAENARRQMTEENVGG